MTRLNTGLLSGLAYSALASAAFAQQGTAPPSQSSAPLTSNPPGTTPSSSYPAAPNTQTQNPATLGEIVVTANRRAENLQNVPITVSAVSGAGLVNAGVSNILDLKSAVPGANVVNSNGFLNAHLRGVGSSNPGPSIESPVAVYVDGVYYASTLGVDLDLVDVQQVEVLKGPQGTLFGRNATGGLIQVTTKDPTQTPTLDIDGSYGNYNIAKTDMYVSGGLLNNLAGSLSATASHQGDGFGTNFVTGRDTYKTDSDVQLRSKLLWTPLEGTKVTTVLDYSQVRNNATFRLVDGTVPAPGTGPAYGGSPYDTDNNAPAQRFVKTGGASIKLDQDTPFFHLSDIVAWRQTSAHVDFDLDSTASPFGIVDGDIDERQFSQELNLQSLRKSFVTWTVGAYYFRDIGRATPFEAEFTGGKALDPLFPLNQVVSFGKQSIESAAGYGQASAEILPGTHLTLGGRYTYEGHKLTGVETLDISGTPVVTAATENAAKNFYRPTWRAALDHRFSPELLAYISVNTGYKSGGFDPLAVTAAPFNSEILTAYEAGFKTNLLANRVTVNGSAFYYDYKNLQVQQFINGGTVIANAPGAHITGGDLDFAARVTADLSVHGGLEYLSDHFTSFPNALISTPAGNSAPMPGSAVGNELPLAPDAVVDLGAEYQVHNIFGGDATLSAAYVYSTGYYFEPDNILHQPDYSDLNLSIRWKSPDRHYSVQAFANNVTNATIGVFGTTETFGNHQEQYQAPRLYGVTVGYHF